MKPMHVIFSGKGNIVQKQNDIISGGPIINIYIVCKITPKAVSNSFVFKNILFGTIKVSNTQKSDKKKWQHSGYGLTFDSTNTFKNPDTGKSGKNIIIFGTDLSDSKYENNKKQS